MRGYLNYKPSIIGEGVMIPERKQDAFPQAGIETRNVG